MKVVLLFACIIALLAVATQAGSLQDEIDAALKKYCSGITISSPKKNQVFSNPKKVTLTVTRSSSAKANVINGVDLYSINSKGKATYLGSPWKGSYTVNKKATLTVDLTKIPKLKLPSQFEFRVWVHNKSGPDCTFMSKTFKAKSSAHSNAVEEQEIMSMDDSVDRGCFGVAISKPAIGTHVKNGIVNVQIAHESYSQVDTLKSLELFRVNLGTHETVQIKESWSGEGAIQPVINFKDKISDLVHLDDNEYAYFYKLEATTQHDETCEFFSHPFYIDV